MGLEVGQSLQQLVQSSSHEVMKAWMKIFAFLMPKDLETREYVIYAGAV